MPPSAAKDVSREYLPLSTADIIIEAVIIFVVLAGYIFSPLFFSYKTAFFVLFTSSTAFARMSGAFWGRDGTEYGLSSAAQKPDRGETSRTIIRKGMKNNL